MLQIGDGAQQCSLAATGRTDQGHEAAKRDVQRHVRQRHCALPVQLEDDAEECSARTTGGAASVAVGAFATAVVRSATPGAFGETLVGVEHGVQQHVGAGGHLLGVGLLGFVA